MMVEINCPMCGIKSDANKEECPFCGARLKPLQDASNLDYEGGDLPDWLKGIKDAENTALPSSPEEELVPDWLQDLRDQPVDIPMTEKAEQESWDSDSQFGETGGEEDSADWLNRFPLETSPSQDFVSKDTIEIDEKSQQVEPADVTEPFTQEIQDRIAPPEEEPDRLAEIEKPNDLFGMDQETEIPEDVTSEVTPEQIQPFDNVEEEIPRPTSEVEQEERLEEDLEWLDELGTAFSGFHPETGLPIRTDAAFSSEIEDKEISTSPKEILPLLISKIETEDETAEKPATQVEEQSDLFPVELPSWLKDMRPVEAIAVGSAAASDKELEKTESAGPLAGLKGILPAEPDVSQTQKPKTYSVKLHVTDEQKYQSNLLIDMIKAEGVAIPTPASPVITPQHLLRIGIASVLFISILFSLVTGIPDVGASLATSEVSEVFKLIESLQTGSPVLLAIDYDPAYSGEMDSITGVIVNHLISRGLYLTFISSISTGAIQAEHLLAMLNQGKKEGFSTPQQYINLGFIPGEATGLYRFAKSPKQVIPFDIKGKPAWNVHNIQRVESISGFSLVIVATENPDIARSWIEQVEPLLEGSPLMMIVSAQAEPITRPYYSAYPRQVQGLINGLTDGVAYNSLLKSSERIGEYWPPYNVGMLFAGLLIAIGGMVNLALAYRVHRKKSDASGK